MKATLEFDLDDYTERKAHKRCISATDAYAALHEIDNMLREYTKYGRDISEGEKIALPEGYHVITEVESELLHNLADSIRSRVGHIIHNQGVDMCDLD